MFFNHWQRQCSLAVVAYVFTGNKTVKLKDIVIAPNLRTNTYMPGERTERQYRKELLTASFVTYFFPAVHTDCRRLADDWPTV